MTYFSGLPLAGADKFSQQLNRLQYLALLSADQEELCFERTVDGTEFGNAWDNDILLTEIVKTLSKKDTLTGRIAKILSNNEKYKEAYSGVFK